MENNTINNIDELTLMRSQIETLKKRLDENVKLNDTNIRKLLKRNIGFIRKYLLAVWIAVPVTALMFIGMKYFFGVSWAVTIATILLVTLDACCDTHFSRMKDEEMEGGSLIEISEKLLWMKRMRRKQLLISLPLLMIWFAWFAVEAYMGIENGWGLFPADHIAAIIIVGCAVVGGIIGGIIGYITYRRMQRDVDDVVEQIEDLKDKAN